MDEETVPKEKSSPLQFLSKPKPIPASRPGSYAPSRGAAWSRQTRCCR